MNQMNLYTFSGEQESNVEVIVNTLTELANVDISENKTHLAVFSDVYTMDKKEYKATNQSVKEAILEFCLQTSGMAGLADVSTPSGLVTCFSASPVFTSMYNSIIAKAVSNVILNANPTAILNFCNIETVEVGGSFSATIEPKNLPIAQRNSYTSNVALLDGCTQTNVIITPKVYSVGTQIDYLRILDKTFDFGREIARVAMSLMWAQYRLVVGLLFDTTKIVGTPFYLANYSQSAVVELRDILEAVNGGAQVTAYGSASAFQKAGAINTNGRGFTTQDEMIRQGFLSHENGMDNVALPQATDASLPFTNANIQKNLLLPTNQIVMLSSVGSKPVTLVRENLVRVFSKDAMSGSLYTQSYSYFMSFDAGIATQANYAIVSTTTA